MKDFSACPGCFHSKEECAQAGECLLYAEMLQEASQSPEGKPQTP